MSAKLYTFLIRYETTDGESFGDEITSTSWCRANGKAKQLNAHLDGILAATICADSDEEHHYETEGCPVL